MYNKLSKKELNKKIKNIYRLKYRHQKREKFKQLNLNEKYYPYLISTYGRVLSLNYRGIENKSSFLKINKRDYLQLDLWIDDKPMTFLLHRLVAITFIPNPDNKPEVNHKDGDKHNPCVWNLEWVTTKENDYHARVNNLKQTRYGEDIGNHIFSEDMIIHVCELLIENKKSIKEISNETGVTYDMIRHILHGESWKHITSNYDFSNYMYGKTEKELSEREEKIHTICKLLASNMYSLKEISKMVGLSYSMIYKILNKESWCEISKLYNIDNYTHRH